MEKRVWLNDLDRLEGLLPYAEDAKFREEWADVKQRNKERLAHYVKTHLGLEVNTHAMFDVQIKVSDCDFELVWCGALMRGNVEVA